MFAQRLSRGSFKAVIKCTDCGEYFKEIKQEEIESESAAENEFVLSARVPSVLRRMCEWVR